MTPLALRFWLKVDQSGEGCWEWKGHRHADGYGQIHINKRQVPAHRVSWELTNGPIPDGLWVLHRCDNPPCVRPDHLFLGTAADNSADRNAKGRVAAGERHGRARLTASDVSVIRAACKTRSVTHRELARRFGVATGTIGMISNGTNWRDK